MSRMDARPAWPWWGLPACLLLAGFGAYANSFAAPFLFDDFSNLLQHERLHRLWPVGSLLWGTMRPLVDLSLALNYALSGTSVWSYRVVNVAIHLAAALALFGLVRRTLLSWRLRDRYATSASWLAFAIALLWLVHPLHTQSVTYLIQRAESLMGLWYLLTLYCVARAAESAHGERWQAAAVGSAVLGIGSKEIMVTAPLLVALYDRIFLARSWAEAWHRRRGLYVGLLVAWAVLGLLVVTSGKWVSASGQWVIKSPATPLQYAATEAGVVLHYLRLALWPHPLVLDYFWPLARHWQAVAIPAYGVGALGLLTLWALRRHPAIGFLGAWFFVILAPTSSFLPTADPALEHRMYLPLAGVITLVVCGVHAGLKRWVPSRGRIGLAGSLLVLSTTLLMALTIRRNATYRSEIAIWQDTVAKRPQNARAYDMLGTLLAQQGRLEEAAAALSRAVRLRPDYAAAHSNFCYVLTEQGKLYQAIAHCTQALRLEPGLEEARYNLGNAWFRRGDLDQAVAQYTELLRRNPGHARTHHNLAVALVKRNRLEEAATHLAEAVRLQPDFAEARANLGYVLTKLGRYEEAVASLKDAVRREPRRSEAQYNLGNAFAALGRFDEAEQAYRDSLALAPDYAKAHNNLGTVLVRQGRLEEARQAYAAAVEHDPTLAQARDNLEKLRTKR